MLDLAPFIIEGLAVTPTSVCHLIHLVVELVHADSMLSILSWMLMLLFHLLSCLVVLFEGCCCGPFKLFYIFSLCELCHRVINRPVTQTFCRMTAKRFSS